MSKRTNLLRRARMGPSSGGEALAEEHRRSRSRTLWVVSAFVGIGVGGLARAGAAPPVMLSGDLSGSFTYYNRSVVTVGPVTLTGNVSITVYGGSISFYHPVSCRRLDGRAWDGPDGRDGETGVGGLAETPGQPGSNGYDLTLTTRQNGGVRGGVSIGAPVTLAGGRGGNGGKGTDAWDDYDAQVTWAAHNGAPGAPGGSGGTLRITACYDIAIGAAVAVDGGAGGAGGAGGKPSSETHEGPNHTAGAGASAGAGGSAGAIAIAQVDAYPTSVVHISSGVTLSARGGDGGDGGAGGGDWAGGRRVADAGCSGERGGAGGIGGFGSTISISGSLVWSDAAFVTTGGRGGSGGWASDSSGEWPGHDWSGAWIMLTPGAGRLGGPPAPGGQGGSVSIQASADASVGTQYIGGSFDMSGGAGGSAGNSGHSGGGDTMGWNWHDGTNGLAGQGGGAGGFLEILCGDEAHLTLGAAVKSDGGAGGRGGDGGCCSGRWNFDGQDWFWEGGDRGGNGGLGAGGAGAGGAAVSANQGLVDVTGTVLQLNGGSGGDGGDGWYHGGLPGLGGVAASADGSLTVTGAVEIGQAVVVDVTQHDGEPGTAHEYPPP